MKGHREQGRGEERETAAEPSCVPGRTTLKQQAPGHASVQLKREMTAPLPSTRDTSGQRFVDCLAGTVQCMTMSTQAIDSHEGRAQQIALQGVEGGGSPLPFHSQIQQSFGHHDVSGVSAHMGDSAAAASESIGAEAYAVGNQVAFKSSPTLHTAAHEAAHVVQQRGGVQLKGNVGEAGDAYEQHADAVADLVVQGKSAESLLDTMSGSSSSQAIQRQASPSTPRAAPTTGKRDLVQEAIRSLRESAERHTASQTAPDLEQVLSSWSTIITTNERIILDELAGDPSLFQALRAAYRHALRTVMASAARVSSRPEQALYEDHRPLIPEWAFPTQQVANITTPLPIEATVDRGSGEGSLTIHGLRVILQSDQTGANTTETHYEFNQYAINFASQNGLVTSFTGPGAREVRIHTAYARGVTARDPSGYGRGTTREDIASGQTSIGFHEGSHGTDFLRYIRAHPYPQFQGRIGMRIRSFQNAMTEYQHAVNVYSQALDADSTRRTDCAGRSIDQYNTERGRHEPAQCVPN